MIPQMGHQTTDIQHIPRHKATREAFGFMPFFIFSEAGTYGVVRA
jgi:hypothetical protein